MVRTQSGMSLIELLTATAISAVLMSAVVFVSKDVFTAATKSAFEENVNLVRHELIRTILNKKAWGYTVERNQTNPISNSLYCVKDPSNNCASTANSEIDIYNDNNQALYRATESTVGFTRQGHYCDSFSNYEPAGGCALRYSVRWRPVCAGACTNPQIEITGKLVSSTEAKALFPSGTEPHDFVLLIDQLAHYNPLAIGNFIYVNQGDNVNINVLDNDIVENLAEIKVVQVSQPSTPGSSAVIESDNTITYTADADYHGMDVFSYTIEDNWGGQSKAQIAVLVMTPYTWTGNGGTGIWHDGSNWCGMVVDGACQGASSPPTNSDTAIFDSTCFRNCDANINAHVGNSTTIGVRGIEISLGFGGTVVQENGVLLNIGLGGIQQQAAVFAGGNSDIITNKLALSGGTFISTSGKLRIRGYTSTMSNSAFVVDDDYIPTFNHNNGTVEYFGWGNSLLKVQNLARLNDLLITKAGGDSNLHLDGELAVDGTLILNTVAKIKKLDSADAGIINLFGNLDAIRCNSGYGKIRVRGNASILDGQPEGWLPTIEIDSPGTVTVNGMQLGASFRYTAGNIVFNTPLVEVSTQFTSWFYPEELRFPSVSFKGSAPKQIMGTLYVEGDFTVDHGNVYSQGVIDVKGDVRSIRNGTSGSTRVRLTGTNQRVEGSIGAQIPALEIASSGLTEFIGDIEVSRLLKYTSGTVSEGVSTVHFVGGAAKWINTGSSQLNNVTLRGGSSSTGVVNDVFIRGNLLIDMGQNYRYQSSGNFVIEGDVTLSRAGAGVDDIGFKFVGSAIQTFIRNGGELPRGDWIVDKSGGSLRLGTDLDLGDRNLTVKDGQTLDLAGHTLTITGTSQLILEGSATVTGGTYVGNCTGTGCP